MTRRSAGSAASGAAAAVVPIILAAGPSGALPLPKALARFGRRTALEIALANTRTLARPVVVLGAGGGLVRRRIPSGVECVVNRHWRRGQIGSLRAGLRRVPRTAAFLIYPVDYPLLTRAVVLHLVRAFHGRRPEQQIAVPSRQGRGGHPVIFAPELRGEVARSRTLRDLVYRDPGRVQYVRVRSTAIWADFDTLNAYARARRRFARAQ